MDQEGGAETIVPGEVLELLEERSRIQGWLDRLAELRAETTPAVHEKVKGDYEQRLQSVNGRLAEHRSDLETSAARHRSRVEKLQEEHDAAATRLEEAELRYRVGEYAEDDWERHREEGEAKARDLEAQLDREREALATLERVLGELVTGRRAAAEAPSEGGAEAEGRDEATAEGPAGASSGEETLVKAWGTGQRGLTEAGGSPTPEAEETRAPPSEAGAEASEAAVASAEAADDPARAGDPSADAADASGEAVDDAAADYLDELEFLESLSLDETDRFDAVSAMLDEEKGGESEEGAGREEGRSS